MRDKTYLSQQASALIMVILMLALMVSVAVSFMNIVGRQQGSAVGVALQTHADIALQQAQVHTIRTFVESIQDTERNDGTTVQYTTSRNAAWRKEFNGVADADADPWTENDRTRTASPSSWSSTTLSGSTTTASKDPLINNTKTSLFGMMGHAIGGYGMAMSTPGDDLTTRWYNQAYLTSELEPIVIDDSLPENDKAILRKSARYIVRYTAAVYDVNGALNINNNYPDVLADGTNIDRGSGPIDNLHYIRQQNYLKNFGRSIKSMSSSTYMFSNWGGSTQYRTQQRNDANFTITDPLDKETVSIREDGLSHSLNAYGDLNRDGRLRMERGFRGGDLQFIQSSDYKTNAGAMFFGTAHKGRVYTWMHMNAVRMGASQGSPPYWFVPFADGMRDSDLADPGASVPVREVSTPWRINLLSAPIYSLRALINGLSSEARISRTKFCNADLFGVGYPEAFPLSFEAGKNIPLFSYDLPFSNVYGASGSIMQGGNGDNLYFDSYVLDVITAFSHTMMQARRAWDAEQADILTSNRYSDGNTFINPAATTNANGEMIEQILRECYRILGEHAVNAGVNNAAGVADAAGTTSLLSGEASTLGSGGGTRGNPDVGCPIFTDVTLHPGDDTRAMEYFLNDFFMSLFGTSNPSTTDSFDDLDVNGGVTIDNSLAVDFNGDGHVESTVTGWYNPRNTAHADNTTWSWWWDGLGPYVRVSAANDYMKRPGWYRFNKGDLDSGRLIPYRKVGSEWVAVPDIDTFYEYNDLWLREGADFPIKPFSKTGRFFIGKSKMFYSFIRSEVYDVVNERVSASASRNFAYQLDPNDDGDFSDNTLLIQSEIELINE